MTNWRDAILAHFVPHVSRLTIVADPDALLTEERLAVELQQKGFDLIEFTDSVEFRYAYESQYRSVWDRGERTDLVVVLRLPDSYVDSLPYDLLCAGRRLAFDLGSLFPHFSYPVLQSLDRGLLDEVFDAQARAATERMGDNATKDFILRHVFGIAAELIASDTELLRALLQLHYRSMRLPPVLSDRLVQVLKSQSVFRNWPLEAIVPDDATFYAFLQERWPGFLRGHDNSGLKDEGSEYGLTYSGPDHLPFGHQDIRVYVDNLFVEGKLKPVRVPAGALQPQSWMQSGILKDVDSSAVRTDRLFELIDAEQPSEGSRYTDWLAFAQRWAELSALVHSANRSDAKGKLLRKGSQINEAFARWLDGHYASLVNVPPSTPAMVHHVARHIARELEKSKRSRAALVVVDGLALDQWITVRRVLEERDQSLLIHESAVFAWIPTLTSISRQAIFAGRPPLYFPTSIYSTNAEGNLWRKLWEDAGFSKPEIAYQRALGNMPSSGDVSETLDAALISPKTRVAGLVVDTVDRIMHGMQLGSAGMHNQIAQWCENGFLGFLIGALLDKGFDVWLTADHGNIECRGMGRPGEGVIAEIRGERVRIYPTPELRDQTAAAFSFARKWNPIGLPAETFPLVAQGEGAFGTPGETLVGHGGVAIEEVVVPLIRFERREVR
jgi:hypothetical protein